jgi:hypothetical protein
MHRPVESPIAVLLCIPSGMHPSVNLLSRFAAHPQTMDGMHSGGMQPEVADGFSTERRIPPGCRVAGAFLWVCRWPEHFGVALLAKNGVCGSVIGRNEATKGIGR